MLSTPLQFAPLLAEITWSIRLMAIAFVIVSVFMMLVILIQKPKGGGLSGAFGGAGGSDTSFVGAKVGDFLTILTVGCFLTFLLLGMGLTWAINPTENSVVSQQDSSNSAGMGASDTSESEADPVDADPEAMQGDAVTPDAAMDAASVETDTLVPDATDATAATDAPAQ